MGKSIEKKTRMTLREAEIAIRNGIADSEFDKKNNALEKREIESLKNAATQLKESRDFLDEVAAKERYSTGTFRYGFIGNKVWTEEGSEFVQVSRGKPYGYIVAVYDEKSKKIYVGFTYVSDEEQYAHPIIGQAIALKRAIDNRTKGVDIEIYEGLPYLKSGDKLQFKHFKERAYRYFRPDEFSHSRGTTPIEESNFDSIHVWQYIVQALGAKNKESYKDIMKKLDTTIKNLNKNLK